MNLFEISAKSIYNSTIRSCSIVLIGIVISMALAILNDACRPKEQNLTPRP